MSKMDGTVNWNTISKVIELEGNLFSEEYVYNMLDYFEIIISEASKW